MSGLAELIACAGRPLAAVDAPIAAHFTGWDWLVLLVYLAGTTWLGARLAGKQSTIREFFLGGRRLPWWAVSGSIVATEVSAVTFISVPGRVFSPGGNFGYLQLALGAIVAKLLIAAWLVPAYYAREIYSPYDFIRNRLGAGAGRASTALFMLGAVLAQGVRVLLTALVLEVVTGIPLWQSIWIIGVTSVVWTLLGGITTVIWTDVIQFGVLITGAIVALAWVSASVSGGLAGALETAAAAGKLRVWNLSLSPALEYTLWSGLLGMTFNNLASLGTDQVMAQRMFCCRGAGDARKAVIASLLGLAVPITMLLVGAALFAYYQQHPLSGDAAAMVSEKPDRVFPIFIVQVLPVGMTGLLIAAVFAAAISTLDSTLAALAQTTVSVLGGLRGDTSEAEPRRADRWVWWSKVFVVFWGVALSGVATALIPVKAYRNIIDLALAVPGFTYGALLGMLLLALLSRRCDDHGLIWAIPTSVLSIVALTFHQTWVRPALATCAALLVALGIARLRQRPAALAAVIVAVAFVGLLHWLTTPIGDAPARLTLAYPWSYPIGTLLTLVLGWACARRRPAGAAASPP